jgi:hypothetical protein
MRAQSALANSMARARERGRPGERCGYVPRRAIMRCCQRSNVSGRTGNTLHERRGATRLSAANTSRSDDSNRGRPACRRRMATSCRSTRISSSSNDRSGRAAPTTQIVDRRRGRTPTRSRPGQPRESRVSDDRELHLWGRPTRRIISSRSCALLLHARPETPARERAADHWRESLRWLALSHSRLRHW